MPDGWYPTYEVLEVKANNGDWLQNGQKTNTTTQPKMISTILTWERVKSWNIGLDSEHSIIG